MRFQPAIFGRDKFNTSTNLFNAIFNIVDADSSAFLKIVFYSYPVILNGHVDFPISLFKADMGIFGSGMFDDIGGDFLYCPV